MNDNTKAAPQGVESDDVSQRVGVTMGCINVEPAVYQKLMDCCSNQQMEVIE